MHSKSWLPIRILVGISLPHQCCTTVSPETNLSLFFYVHIVFAYTSVSLCIFKILPSVCSVRSSAGNFYASHVSYLEHNSSQLEVSWAKKGAWEKIKTSHDWRKVIFSLFLSHLLISLILKNLKLQALAMIIKIMRKISYHAYAFSFLTFTNSKNDNNSSTSVSVNMKAPHKYKQNAAWKSIYAESSSLTKKFLNQLHLN